MLAWNSSKFTDGRKSVELALSTSSDSILDCEKLYLGLLPMVDCPKEVSLVEVGRYEGRREAALDSLVILHVVSMTKNDKYEG
jgi:hypothetical protein